MKTTQKICLALSLSLCLSGTALADYRHHGHYDDHYRSHWGGNAALLTIAGVAIGATAYNYYAPPPVYYQPTPRVIYTPPYVAPVAPPPAVASWYYCASSGQYYPYVRHCPEGWQAVMPTPPQ
jgi:hypothetical protein